MQAMSISLLLQHPTIFQIYHLLHLRNRLIKESVTFNHPFTQPLTRVARCPVFDRTVRFFGDLSGQKYDAKPDN